ncbi:hypothetical protein POP12_089 [Pectobacterium phage POP12]|nr:hypothetical protein POP12_089 [Pectobacterium phage POP12]
MYWFIFSDQFAMKCSLSTAKKRADLTKTKYTVLCTTRKPEMEKYV